MNKTEPNREPKDSFFSVRNPIIYGTIGTILVFGVYAHLGASRSCQKGVCQSNYKHFLASPPNEIGDTLAGVAGILAFLWIIITVFLQSKELRIARKEYEKMANAQTGQLELLAKQGAIFENEQTQREQNASEDVFNQMLMGVWYQMTTMPLSWISWTIPEECYEDVEYEDQIRLFQLPETDNIHQSEDSVSVEKREEMIRLQGFYLEDTANTLEHCRPFMNDEHLPERPSSLETLIYAFGKIRKLEDQLSSAQRQRLENLRIAETHFFLRMISEKNDWWHPIREELE